MKQLTLSALALLLVACSNSDEDSNPITDPGSSLTPQTGVFVDAPVAGLTYTSESFPMGNLTNENGEFTYIPGETLSFSLGGVSLGQALGDDIITPLDLLGTNEVNDAVLNMAQLLQTLDSDDNPDTITISEETRTLFATELLDFNDSGFDQNLQSILDGQEPEEPEEPVTVVEESQAQIHLEQTFVSYEPADGVGFTLEQLSDTTFYFLDDGHFESSGDEISSTSVLTFNADGSGLIRAYSEEPGTGLDISWQRKIDGRLLISQDDSLGVNSKNLLIGISDIDSDNLSVSWVETNSDSYVEDSPAYSRLPSWMFRFKLSGLIKGTGVFYTQDRHLGYSIDLREKVAESVVTDSRCSSYDMPAGFDYTFDNTRITRVGTDSIDTGDSICLVGPEETETFVVTDLEADFDLPFNCETFPICSYSDFNKTLTGTSGDQTTTSSYEHILGSDSVTYTVTYQPANYTVTEEISLLDPPVGFATLDLSGQTFYISYANEDLADQWEIEALSFSETGNNVDLAGSPGTYEIIDGVLVLSLSSGEMEYIGLLGDLGNEHWTTCWADDIATSADCTGLSIEHMFSSQVEAQTFTDEQNSSEPEPQTGGFSDISLAGQTFYNTYADDGLSDYWVIEQLTFAASGNGINLDGSSGTYELVDGVLVVSLSDGDVENIGLLEDLGNGHLTTCWASSVATATDCTGLGIEHFFSAEVDAESYASEQNVGRINLLDITATSVITHSACASYDKPAGFFYSFQDTVMTRVGSDSIDTETSACVVGISETQSFTMTDLGADFDLPFNCETYPICSAEDLNKTLLGTSGSQSTTATYTYEEGSNTINYVVDYQPDNVSQTEVITLHSEEPLYPFTESELQDFTWFFAVSPQAECGDLWVVEELSFNSSGYTLDECGLGLGTEVDQPYQVLANGIVNLATHNDFLNRLSFNEDLQAYVVCWANSASDAVNCPVELQGYAFLNVSDAAAYVEAQNTGFGTLLSGSFQSVGSGDEFPTTFVLNADKSGTWSYQSEGGSITWAVNDAGQLVITFETSETETYTLTSGTIDSGTVDVVYSNEPDITGVSWGRISEVMGDFDYVTFDAEGHRFFVNKIGSYSFTDPMTINGSNTTVVKEYNPDGSFVENVENRTSTFNYTNGVNGKLTAISGPNEVTGYVSSDSDFMIVEGNIRSDAEMGITLGIQPQNSGSLSIATINGSYNYVAFNYNGRVSSEEQFENQLGKYVFDGLGGINKNFNAITVGYNVVDDSISDPVSPVSLSGDYSVNSSGQFNINSGQLEGISSDDGKVIAISNNMTGMPYLGIGVALKEESGLYSNAMLQGSYNAISFGVESHDEFYNDLGTLQFDGSAILTRSGQSEIKTVNESGVALRTDNTPNNGTFSYQVTADGVIEISSTPVGIVSGDGRIVVIADYLTGASRAGITIAIKQP